jgi:hypothetical protein
MTKQETRLSDFMTGFEQLTTALTANAEELPHLEAPRKKLEAILAELRGLAVEQGVHAANKQQASQRLRGRLADGRKLATFLRNGVKEHYGNRNDKVVEFGIQPFRRRKREAFVKQPPPPAPVPVATPVAPGPGKP